MTGLVRDAYDLTRDAFILGALGAEYCYWTVRTWGVTDAHLREIGTAFAFVGAACLFTAPANLAALLVMPARRKKTWGFYVRNSYFPLIAVVAIILIFTAPATRPQSKDNPFGLPHIVKEQGAQIRTLEQSVTDIRNDVKTLTLKVDKQNELMERGFAWIFGALCTGLAALVGAIFRWLWNRFDIDVKLAKKKDEAA